MKKRAATTSSPLPAPCASACAHSVRAAGSPPRSPGRALERDLREHAERPRPAPAQRDERLGLAVQPVRRERRRLRPLVALDHRQDLGAVAGPQRVGVHPPERRPVPEGARHRVPAVEEDQVRDGALVPAAGRRADPRHDVAADAAVQRLVERGVAPAQVGVDDVAREIVREHALRAALHERARAQPREQLARVLVPERGAQQVLRRHAGARGDLQRLPVALARHAGDEALQQRPHDVRSRGELGLARALRQHLGEQPQRERMAVGDADEAFPHLLRDPGAREQLARLLRAQVAHRDDAQELAPAGVAPPCLARRLAAGDHDERRRGEIGHEALAQPVLQRGRGLEGVEQEHDPPARGERAGDRRRAGHAERGREGRLESRPATARARAGRAARGASPAASAVRPRGTRLEQRRLAHAAGAVDEQHAERRLLGLERPPEQLDPRRRGRRTSARAGHRAAGRPA